jgi:two-component system, chemotaxis family, protein-glutamate methylesterase/glutaminase
MNSLGNSFEAVVIGASAGGIHALSLILAALPPDFPLPLVIVQHVQANNESYLAQILARKTRLRVKEADEKESLVAGTAYTAPPGYHLLIEADRSLSLSLEGLVHYARPSVDVLFESAVHVYRQALIGVILTGANSDGAEGLRYLTQMGGYAIVQDPSTAESKAMPAAAIAAAAVNKILPLKEIGPHILHILTTRS